MSLDLSLLCPLVLVLAGALALGTPVPLEAAGAPRGPLAEALQPFEDEHSLAGAVVLVADKDRVLDLETVGYADVEARKPMRADSLFWIASQTKPMTVAAVMMLVDEGKLALDDPVEKYLPEFHDLWWVAEEDAGHRLLRRPARPITLRDVLSHMSGLAFSSLVEQPTLDALPLRTAVLSYAQSPLQSQPGTRFSYANAGINTAARVLEVVSGLSYEEFLQKRLLKPLGMKDTTFRPTREQVARLARSYAPDEKGTGLKALTITQLTYPLEGPGRYPMPAGGLFSTAQDAARFCRMVLNGGTLDGHRYLSATAVEEMTRRQTPPDQTSYGLGWSVDGDTIGHGGAYATDMLIDRKRGLVLVFLVQHAGFPLRGKDAQGAFVSTAQKHFGNTRSREGRGLGG
ncbi:MAG TPA: serine hydrolase domain-containing protein [Armatimonadota bacterium]|jgi:CubicO group peptidase (beta-lactamase class C family)